MDLFIESVVNRYMYFFSKEVTSFLLRFFLSFNSNKGTIRKKYKINATNFFSTFQFTSSFDRLKKKKILCNDTTFSITSNAHRNKVILESASTFLSPSDKTQRPPFPFFPAVPSARKNIFLPLDSNHTCSPPSFPLSLFPSPSLLKFAHEFISRSTG